PAHFAQPLAANDLVRRESASIFNSPITEDLAEDVAVEPFGEDQIVDGQHGVIDLQEFFHARPHFCCHGRSEFPARELLRLRPELGPSFSLPRATARCYGPYRR